MVKIGIYKITSPSNKVYIGQSINIEKRFKGYYRLTCEEQPKLYNSLKKYGPENHIFEIIEECLEEQLDEREIYWINYFNSLKEGLNLKEGGHFGRLSEESKKKISLKNLGTKKPKSKEFGEKRSKLMKGNKYALGNKFSEKVKQNISQSLIGNKFMLGYKMSEETKLKQSKAKDKVKRKIYCPELNQEFESICEASRKLNINLGSLSGILNGSIKKTRNGLTFKYL